MSLIDIRCSGVPEHFNLPWKISIEKDLFKALGVNLLWKDNASGTGAMCQDLKDDKTDLAIVLTEGAISNIAKNNPSKICSLYVNSPLIWGVHTSSNCTLKKEKLKQNAQFSISRYTSGSHLMVFLYLQALQVNTTPNFSIVNDLMGARQQFKSIPNKLFLWEKFTTKPPVDSGEFLRIDEIPSPWPAFVVLASNRLLEQHSELLQKVLTIVQQQAVELKKEQQTIAEIARRYQLKEQDAAEWFRTIQWSDKTVIDYKVIKRVLKILRELQLVTTEQPARSFIHNFTQ